MIVHYLLRGENLKDYCCHSHMAAQFVVFICSTCCIFLLKDLTMLLLLLRYKLHAVMEDETGSVNVMIFDDAAQKLVGVAAEELNGAITGDGISAVISSQHRRAFVVTCGNGCFVVKHVLNDDELQRLDSGFHIEAGDDSDLSQDEGSYASDGSSLQVKKVECDSPLIVVSF